MRSIVAAVTLLMLPGIARAQEFNPPIMLPAGSASIAAGDLNGDGRSDLLTLVMAPPQLLVFLADGAGGFRPPVSVNLPGPPAGERDVLAIGDVNRDGRLDVVVGMTFGIVAVFLGDGTGGLIPADGVGISPTQAIHRVALADVTMDGILDLVVNVGETGSLELFPGDGAGGFDNIGHIGIGCREFLIADFTHDGRNDVVTTCAGAALSLYEATAPGSFKRSILSGKADSGAVGDFDKDGMPDFLRTDQGKAYVVIRTLYVTPLPLPVDDAVSAAAGDFNGDGHMDAAFGSAGQRVYVVFGDGSGGFQAVPSTFALAATPVEMVARDLNGDGRDDFLIGSEGARPQVLLSRVPADVGMSASLGRIELSVGGVAATLQTVKGKLDALQMPNLEKLSNLDATVSSRASQQSVNDLGLALGLLDAPVSSRASTAAISELSGKLDQMLSDATERLEGVVLRITIEQALLRGDRLSSLYLPEEHGGVLGRVRQVVVEAIERNEAANLSIGRARELIEKGDEVLESQSARIRERRYRLAFDAYASAYQLAVR